MSKIAVITDTDSSLPPDLAEGHAIQQVPITVHFDGESYTCGVDIDDRRLFEIVDRTHKLPTTAAPTPDAFSKSYQQAFDLGAESILCFCVSSQMSSTYQSAMLALESFPGKDIRVVDSQTLSMAQGFIALTAAETIKQGGTVEEALAQASAVGQRLSLYAVLSTLKYLAMSGRVGKVAAGMANTLNIKPILTVSDGKLVLLEKVRTQKKAVERMMTLVKGQLGDKPIERAAILHINDYERAVVFQEQLCGEFGCPIDSTFIAEFTPGLSVHAGSGVVGVVVLRGK